MKVLNTTTIVIDDSQTFTLYELSEHCQVRADYLIELVEYGLLEPQGERSPETWCFSAQDFKRSQKAIRLQEDLDVNLSGVALALELLEEIDELKTRLKRLERLHEE